MAFLKVALALCASLYVASGQYNPGPIPTCTPSGYMSHETYCDLYYRCVPGSDILFSMSCGTGTQYDPSTMTCNTIGISNTGVCPQWTCNGNNYPDVCCDKYWTCSSNNAWIQMSCPAGTTFDMQTGQCLNTGSVACVEHKLCRRNLVNNPQLTCNLQANPADKCTYIHGANIMPCPTGSSFDATRCGCLNADTRDCATRFDFAKNKLIDDSCRASFRTKFDSSASLSAFSDKLGMSISDLTSAPILRYGGGFYLGPENAVSVNGNEAILSGSGYIYSNYFENNEILAPTAFVVQFKPQGFTTGNVIDLLTNQFSFNAGVTCANSLSVTVRNDGFTNSQLQNSYRYTFNIQLTGFNANDVEVTAQINDLTIVVPQTQSNIGIGDSGSPLNFLRFTLGVSGSTVTAEVVELNSITSLGTSNRQSRTSNFGIQHLKNSMCGLTVGSNMAGRVREFTVYEGCNNSFASLLNIN